MIKSISKQVINGTLTLVETVIYSSGKRVRRVLDPSTGLPTDILPDSPSE